MHPGFQVRIRLLLVDLKEDGILPRGTYCIALALGFGKDLVGLHVLFTLGDIGISTNTPLIIECIKYVHFYLSLPTIKSLSCKQPQEHHQI
jgi:hypothetical protein